MPTLLGTLRRIILAPSFKTVSFQKRGFPVVANAASERLEAIPQSVICGFEWGIETRTQRELEQRLSLVDVELRGFAYEGAAMAYTVRDAMAGGRGHRARDLLMGSGQPHIFLTYIGIGFAMARLPRPLWKKVMPDLTGSPFYPTMTWMAPDGYAFDRAYFDTAKWVDRQQPFKPYPWAGSPEYFLRVCDFGVGRALWFIHGGRPAGVVAAVRRFAPERHGDLYSGVGLAAAFAGGARGEELEVLLEGAGEHRAQVGLGAVLAVKGRHFSGYVPEHTAAAAMALTGMTVTEVLDLAERSEPATGAGSVEVPPYELWRRNIRECFEATFEATEVSEAGTTRRARKERKTTKA